MAEKEVMVLCYWHGCVKYGPDGVYYQGSTPKKISVKLKTEFSKLVDGLYLITGLDKQRLRFNVFGRYPVVVSPNLFTYVHFPVVNDSSLETMLEVPSIHPFINSVELYLEVNPISDDVINPAACSSPLDNPGSFSKRQRTQQPQEANGYVDMEVTHPAIKLERDNGLEANADFGNNSGEDFESLDTVVIVNAQSEVIDMNEENAQIESQMNEEVTYSQAPEHNATKAISKRRRTSVVWKDFESEDEEEDGKVRAKCLRCDTKLVIGKRHGTNQLKRHLEKCLKMPRKGDRNSGLDGEEVTHAINLTAEYANVDKDLIVPGLEVSATACLNKGVNSSASKPWSLSNLWFDDHELLVGLCFKDIDELKKAVEWCSIRGQQKCVVRETEKDKYVFKCIRWKCNWSLWAARMEERELVEITKCSGPHTCCPIRPDKFNVEFTAEEIECLIRVQPTLTIDELRTWWLEKFGYELETAEMKIAKQEAIKKLYGDWDQSYRILPKLMAALHSSNGLLVEWQYDRSPNPEFASFRGVFWAFSQSVEGFTHCKPLIEVDTKDLSGKYPMQLMIASGFDAEDYCFPLAFAVTREESTDSWRWFLSGIREKVTQRKGLCLITSLDPDILAVINKPGSLWQEPWAYHRFCLNRVCSHFQDIFQDVNLKNLVEEAGVAMQQDEFDSHMETIKKKNPKARRWLDQMHPHQWAFAHDGGRRYGVMTMNTKPFCESFPSPSLPVTAVTLLLFDELRMNFHQGLSNSRSKLNQGDMYTKPVMDMLEEFRKDFVTYVVMPLDNNAFQVTTPIQNDGWIVQLSEYTCTCGEFQKKKFPCLHALAVCETLKINPLQCVDDCYTLEQYYKTYSAKFNPVPEVSAWPKASGVPTLFPPVILPSPPPTQVSGKRKESETSPKAFSERNKTEKPTKEQSKSASIKKPVKGKGKDKTKEIKS